MPATATVFLMGKSLALERGPNYLSCMRRRILWLLPLCLLLGTLPARAATGRVIKVLPQFLGTNGLASLSPSLYDRDAYQFQLEHHPNWRTGMRFMVQWKSKGPVWEPLTIRVELRGTAQGNLPKQLVIDKPVEPARWFSSWTSVALSGEDYQGFGEVTAWRVRLWEGKQVLGEQRSFLW
jgi:hypothetical protein